MTHLPEDVVSVIAQHLPTIFLLRYRCLSRTWYTTLTRRILFFLDAYYHHYLPYDKKFNTKKHGSSSVTTPSPNQNLPKGPFYHPRSGTYEDLPPEEYWVSYMIYKDVHYDTYNYECNFEISQLPKMKLSGWKKLKKMSYMSDGFLIDFLPNETLYVIKQRQEDTETMSIRETKTGFEYTDAEEFVFFLKMVNAIKLEVASCVLGDEEGGNFTYELFFLMPLGTGYRMMLEVQSSEERYTRFYA